MGRYSGRSSIDLRRVVQGPYVLVLALVTSLGLVACAGTVVDDRKASEAVRDDVQRKTGVQVKSVSCPTDVEVVPGRKFTCRVVAADGRAADVELRIRNFDADVQTVSIERASS